MLSDACHSSSKYCECFGHTGEIIFPSPVNLSAVSATSRGGAGTAVVAVAQHADAHPAVRLACE